MAIYEIGSEEEFQRRFKSFLTGEEPPLEHAIGAVHTHVLPNGMVYRHSHEAEPANHTHTKKQTDANTKAILNRLSRAIGHMESIKRMVEDGRDVNEILVQLAAVKSAINNTGKVMLKEHIEASIVEAMQSGDMETIKELESAIDHFIK